MSIETRADLAKIFAERRYKVGAEIGVLEGDFAKVLCDSIPDLKYYGIDIWHGESVEGHHRQGMLDRAKIKLDEYDATLVKKFSVEAALDFDANSLDFVYIDANHVFDAVVLDIISWTPKVKKGGIVSGHDYTDKGTCGVKAAVDGYVKSHSYRLNFTKDESEGISWWFVKRWNS